MFTFLSYIIQVTYGFGFGNPEIWLMNKIVFFQRLDSIKNLRTLPTSSFVRNKEVPGKCPFDSWYRGPSIHNCVYHPHRPGTIRDVARTFRFYCSPECLKQGYRFLADEHCLPCPASDKEDDCMYCPWATIEEDEAAEHSTTATLGPDLAAPGSGRDQSPVNETPALAGSCWTAVANTRTYTPTPEDTDRVLCVKVYSTEPIPYHSSSSSTTRRCRTADDRVDDDSSESEDACMADREGTGRSRRSDNASTDSGPVIAGGTLQPLTSISQTGSGSVYLMTMPCFDPMTYSPPLREMLSVYGALDHIATGQAIKLLNWNILADIYCTPQQYPYCPPWALSWNYRRHLIIKQIAALEGDIVCLQEVQSDHLYTSLLPALEGLGFGYLYAPKTRRIFTDKYCEEGCAILYRKSRFSVVDSFTIEFDAHAKDSARYQGARNTKQRNRLSKGNVALACLLEDSRPLGIVNTHITADVDAGDVKLWQAMCMLEVVQGWSNSQNGVLPVIVCGDFNSTPESAVYELLTTGRLSPSSIPVTLLWRAARNRGNRFPEFMYSLVRPDGRHCVALADAALAHLLAAGRGDSMHGEEDLVRICVLLHRLRPLAESMMGGMSFLARPEIINGFNGDRGRLHPAVSAAAEFLMNKELLERMSPPVLYGVLLKHAEYLPEGVREILLEIFSQRAMDLPVVELQRCILSFGASGAFLERLSKYYGLYDVHMDKQLVNRQCLESLGPVMGYLCKISKKDGMWKLGEMPSLLLHAAHLATVVEKEYKMHADLAVCFAKVGAEKIQSKSVYDVLASALENSSRIEGAMGLLGEVCKAYGLPDRRANFGARGRASAAATRFIIDCIGRMGESTGEELAVFGELLRATKWPMKQAWISLSAEAVKRGWKANRSSDRFRQNDTSPPAEVERSGFVEKSGGKRLSPVHAYRLYHSFANLHEGMAATLLPIVLVSIRQDDSLESLAPLFRACRVGDVEVGIMREAVGKCTARTEEVPRETLWEALRVACIGGFSDDQIERLVEPLLSGDVDLPVGREVAIGSVLVGRKKSEKIAHILKRLVLDDTFLSKCEAEELVEAFELCSWAGGRTTENWNFAAQRKVGGNHHDDDYHSDRALLERLQERVEKERIAAEAMRNLGERQCPSTNGVTAGMGLAFFLVALGNCIDEYLFTGHIL
ncbi:carbon catabolite repressor protein, putative [Perkinsus marinus ATCC 50983]|uniref:Carbon catabolite repressor protein, putative n=1 Tax=Perkinsus marinus (strain ATCC 50983 / TXsc) TaxID=423536 RepID=C5KRE0_PERM5|nr:carbon catabolite repressor protein, putative [Perkinsus marinus ATCC 50983]EER12913.1 carbon catabolite repressor protein, putative [Perkinsus marinus ATCC 50983]|eukprot:XP_002781118.1 carbon catabolite repressor protein, putative [Perkinsus marinus ATCC 50983]